MSQLSHSYTIYRRLSARRTKHCPPRKKNVSFIREQNDHVAYSHLMGTRSLRTTSCFDLGACGIKSSWKPQGGFSDRRSRRVTSCRLHALESYTKRSTQKREGESLTCMLKRKKVGEEEGRGLQIPGEGPRLLTVTPLHACLLFKQEKSLWRVPDVF